MDCNMNTTVEDFRIVSQQSKVHQGILELKVSYQQKQVNSKLLPSFSRKWMANLLSKEKEAEEDLVYPLAISCLRQ